MKRVLSFTVALLTALVLTPGVSADFDAETNYMEIMIDAAVEGDIDKGQQAQLSRDEKIESMETEYTQVDFDDMYLLAKVIQAEAGSEWLSDEWKMAVGEVVLNRVASPEFPNTLEEVVYQPGQYYGKNNSYFNSLLPSERCVEAAARLLGGERVMDEPSVVFQSNGKQGSGVFLELVDSQLGTTYLCYSSHMDLYES